jgi:prepilin-type N-terminal cleavage/methylation domain-containing protein
MKSMGNAKPTRAAGFTIVELLIVIVVIGILAVISVVAYNGIQARAQAANVQGALAQANKKLAAYMVDYSAYPVDQTAFNALIPGTSTTYQYSATPTGSANPTGYCVTATNGTTDYKADSTATQPAAGACAGHGTGGTPALINLAINPSAASLSGYGSAGATGTSALMPSGGQSGASHIRRTFNGTGTGGIYFGLTGYRPIVTAGTIYTASAYLRTLSSATLRIVIEWKDSGGTLLSSTAGTSVVVGTTWTRISATGTAPASAASTTITIYATSTWAINDYEDVDAVMMTAGSTLYNYADGDSSNWVWTATAHASTSTGPAL